MSTQKVLSEYPKRREVYIANLNPGFGREMHKARPVLVISSDFYNKRSSSVIIIPASSIVPQHPSAEMVILGKPEGFEKPSVLLPVYIRSIDKERLVKKIGKITYEKLAEVEEALKFILGFVRRD
jgi:mRNA interferase MazF